MALAVGGSAYGNTPCSTPPSASGSGARESPAGSATARCGRRGAAGVPFSPPRTRRTAGWRSTTPARAIPRRRRRSSTCSMRSPARDAGPSPSLPLRPPPPLEPQAMAPSPPAGRTRSCRPRAAIALFAQRREKSPRRPGSTVPGHAVVRWLARGRAACQRARPAAPVGLRTSIVAESGSEVRHTLEAMFREVDSHEGVSVTSPYLAYDTDP